MGIERVKDFIDLLIKEYRLGVENRVGLLVDGWLNIGDNYFMICAMTYAQKCLKKKYVIVGSEKHPIQIFATWHINNGADIEQIFITHEQYVDVIRFLKKDNLYSGILDYVPYEYEVSYFRNCTSRKDVYENLTRPVFPFFDRKKYVEKYKVVPGKTVFVIPDAGFSGTFPSYFWTMSIGMFKLLGYHVIVNSFWNETKVKYEDAIFCSPPLNDLVPFCNLCGIVYAFRSGLVELIASETTAKMYIFGLQPSMSEPFSIIRSVLKMYPFIDNTDNHIVEIPVPRDRTKFQWINDVRNEINNVSDFMRNNIFLRDKNERIHNEETKKASVFSYRQLTSGRKFVDIWRLRRIQDFCEIKYELKQEGQMIKLSMHIMPIMDWIITIGLKSVSSKKFIKLCDNYNHNIAFFDPEDDGEYYACVHVVHPITGHNCQFETEPISLCHSPHYKIQRCLTYRKYINLLYEVKNDVVIFITSRDAHTNSSMTTDLYMDVFEIETDLKHTFRHSWLCIIDGGKLVEELHSENKEVSAEYAWDGNFAIITSAGYNVNHNDKTSVSVKINNNEYCVNHRGLNFVVWDKKKNQVMDAVCYDTFASGKEAHRTSQHHYLYTI